MNNYYYELKSLAWERLFQGKWFWKLFGGEVILQLAAQAIAVVVSCVFARLQFVSWQDYIDAFKQNQIDHVTPVPELTREFIIIATSTQAVESFLGFILYGIVTFGSAVLLLRCLVDNRENLLSAAFGGFKYPFGILWLGIRQSLIFLGWSLLAMIPAGAIVGGGVVASRQFFETSPLVSAIVLALAFSLGGLTAMLILMVPAYRYRFLWLVKAEHADWSAGECIKATRRMMEGHKMRSFKLDVAYWKPITGVLLLVLVAMLGVTLAGFAKELSVVGFTISIISILAVFVSCVILGKYISLGQGFLYREISEIS